MGPGTLRQRAGALPFGGRRAGAKTKIKSTPYCDFI
jgi:hypothetical protein